MPLRRATTTKSVKRGPEHQPNSHKGKWQSDTDKQHGFQLEMNGKARSLATGPYKYNQWSLYNCKLILLRESEGVHGAETRNDTLDILKLTPDSLVLQNNRKNIPEKFHRIS